MCTIGLSRRQNVIFKNRDKNIAVKEEIIRAPEFIAIRTKDSTYYSIGFNKFGCGFASAAVNSPEWTKLVEEGRQDEARNLFNHENNGRDTPMNLVSRMLPDVLTIEEWITALSNDQSIFRGYNILLVDPSSAKVVEIFGKERVNRSLNEMGVITNHFQNIDFGPKSYDDYPNSFLRYQYAHEALRTSQSLVDIFDMLKPKDEERRRRIWRNSHFFTVSSCIVDLNNKCLYYTQKNNRDYQKIEFKEEL